MTKALRWLAEVVKGRTAYQAQVALIAELIATPSRVGVVRPLLKRGDLDPSFQRAWGVLTDNSPGRLARELANPPRGPGSTVLHRLAPTNRASPPPVFDDMGLVALCQVIGRAKRKSSCCRLCEASKVVAKAQADMIAAGDMAPPPRRRGPTQRMAAEVFLAMELAAGAVRAADIKRRAVEVGLSARTLWRTRSSLGSLLAQKGIEAQGSTPWTSGP